MYFGLKIFKLKSLKKKGLNLYTVTEYYKNH